MKTTLNDLTQYVNSGHPLDPPAIQHERQQLAALLQGVGGAIRDRTSFELEFSAKLEVSVNEQGDIDVQLHGSNGHRRAGAVCAALFALDGQPAESVRFCAEESCGGPFVGPANKLTCSTACARKRANRAQKEKAASNQDGKVTDNGE